MTAATATATAAVATETVAAHVVAHVDGTVEAGERAGDVLAAFFEGAGDAAGHFIDAGCDGVADQGNVLTQIDLHAGNGVTDLLGLADEVVALNRDVLAQGGEAVGLQHLVDQVP